MLNSFNILSMKHSLCLLSLFPMGIYAQQRPNIIYIMSDDHTSQMMSCYGQSPISTPHMDALVAQDGVLFRNSFVANSLSGPSRACMLTGKHSHKNGFTDNVVGVFDGSQQTMPKLLRQAGYQTALIGKWHLVSQPTGFDYYEIVPGQGDYYNPDFIDMSGKYHRERGYLTNIITDKSIQWLEQRDKERPFILFVHHKACHRNWLPEEKYLRLFEDKIFPLPENFFDNWEGRRAAQEQEMSIASDHDMDPVYDTKCYTPGDSTRLSGLYLSFINRLEQEERKTYFEFYDSLTQAYKQAPPSTPADRARWKFQRYMRDYAKVTRSLDDNIGRLTDYLKANGLWENTLVVYTSDQGFYMGEHGWFDKRFMYEESLNTPLLMHLPKGLNRRGDIQEMVQNIDYAPTFLDLAGVPIPQDMQGRSLLPLLRSEKAVRHWRDAIYYHFYEYPSEHSVKRHYGIRTKRWKLIHFYNDIDTWELYDLKSDPKEMNNLYGNPAYGGIAKKLHKQLRKLQKQYDDPIEQKLLQKQLREVNVR